MSARDVLAASLYNDARTIAGQFAMPETWEEYRSVNPEGAMVYETQAGCHLSALSAAGFVIEQDWQPIETAPKEGTSVLVFQRGAALGDIGIDWYAADGWLGKPTHWRPLPAPPEKQP